MSKRRFLFILLLGILTALVVTVTVFAQDPAPTSAPLKAISDNDVNLVAKKLYCPVCPNTPLDVCETKACKDWRAQIKDQLSQGWTEQAVMDYFVTQYGERVLAEPERGGFTSLVWTLPILIFGLGLVVVWLVLRSWRHKKLSQQAASVPSHVTSGISTATLAKIEAEIRKVD